MIYLVRNPLEAIPSRLSLIQAIWKLRFDNFDGMTPSHVEAILEDSFRTYLNAERDLPRVPEHQRFVIPYEQFVARPGQTVEEIYSRFGLPGPDAALAETLRRLQSRDRAPKGIHEYSLKDFGLEKGRVIKELQEVFERFGFPAL